MIWDRKNMWVITLLAQRATLIPLDRSGRAFEYQAALKRHGFLVKEFLPAQGNFDASWGKGIRALTFLSVNGIFLVQTLLSKAVHTPSFVDFPRFEPVIPWTEVQDGTVTLARWLLISFGFYLIQLYSTVKYLRNVKAKRLSTLQNISVIYTWRRISWAVRTIFSSNSWRRARFRHRSAVFII